MTKISFNCFHCGNSGFREKGQLNRLKTNGGNPFCSQKCSKLNRKVIEKSLGWHEARFKESKNCLKTDCLICGKHMWFPASKVGKYKTCGSDCAHKLRENNKKIVFVKELSAPLEKTCETCGKNFHPRPRQIKLGQGKYCSQKCNTASRNALAENESKRLEAIKIARSEGRWTILKGEKNPNWKGGKEICKARRISDGRANAELRRYRKNNPDKVKEFAQRRSGRKLDKLPYGTVPNIRTKQKDKCAICNAKLNGKGHLDHIIPLSKGGKHEGKNLQFLCPPCNLHKSDRDPIMHMQSLGKLL